MIARHDEALPGTPLLQKVMAGGVRVTPGEPLADTKARCREEIARLPAALRRLQPAEPPFRAEVSRALGEWERKVAQDVAAAGRSPA